MDEPRGWHSRGYLPHIDAGCEPQFITWRLDDSVPTVLIDRWKEEIASAYDDEPSRKREMYRRLETYLDEGHGSCILRSPVAAIIVQGTLLHHHSVLYDLHEWAVMPNHVHALLTPLEGAPLERLVHANKSYTSTEIHKKLGGEGRLWQPEYFDRLIRDEGHFQRVAKYIRWNPVKAKLCTDPKQWVYSSANPESAKLLEER